MGLALVSLVMFFLTAYRTIAWWDNCEYSLGSSILGVTHPPGSLIATLVGWIWTKLFAFLTPVFALNLLAGVLAALLAVLICRLVVSLRDSVSGSGPLPWTLGAALGALSLVLGETFWLYAVEFTPYIFTPVFTVLILTAMIKWWNSADRPEAWKWILLLALLFGLDFSVHRTNSLLIPGAILWVLIRRPGTFGVLRNWLAAAVGMVAGLAVHLLTIPIAATKPFLNAGNPDTLSRFWDYVTVKQAGGGFLVQFLPRKGDLVSVQIGDFVKAFGNNFFSVGQDTSWVILPLIMTVLGIIVFIRSKRRMALAMLSTLTLTSILTIAYFNIPADFFRSLHRHYMPCMVLAGFFLVYGSAWLASRVRQMQGGLQVVAAVLIGIVLVYMPVSQVLRNYDRVDGSNNTFARDISRATLEGLPEDAILLTGGDNDTFPLWYLQAAEGVRPDVTVLNLSLLNTEWFLNQVIEREPDLPLQELGEIGSPPQVKAWRDSTVVLFVDRDAPNLGVNPDSVADSILFEIEPSIADKYLLVQDQVVLHLVQENQFRRSLYVGYGTYGGAVSWLRPFLRIEGMASRFVPMESPGVEADILKQNLFERYDLSGYTNESAHLDDVSRQMGNSVWSLFLMLARAQVEMEDTTSCLATIEKLDQILPAKILAPPENMVEFRKLLLEGCKGESEAGEPTS